MHSPTQNHMKHTPKPFSNNSGVSQWNLTAEVFYILEKLDYWAEVKKPQKYKHNCFHLAEPWEQAGQEQGTRAQSVQGSSKSFLLHNSQLQMPTETQAHESHGTSSRKTDNASIPQNIDLNCTATRTCESALLIKRFQLLRSVG